MPQNNAAHIGQTDSRSFEISSAVESLKHTKEFVAVTHVEAYSVIPDENNVLLLI